MPPKQDSSFYMQLQAQIHEGFAQITARIDAISVRHDKTQERVMDQGTVLGRIEANQEQQINRLDRMNGSIAEAFLNIHEIQEKAERSASELREHAISAAESVRKEAANSAQKLLLKAEETAGALTNLEIFKATQMAASKTRLSDLNAAWLVAALLLGPILNVVVNHIWTKL